MPARTNADPETPLVANDDDRFDKSFQLKFAKGRVFRVGTEGRTAARAHHARAEYYRRWHARLASHASLAQYQGRR